MTSSQTPNSISQPEAAVQPEAAAPPEAAAQPEAVAQSEQLAAAPHPHLPQKKKGTAKAWFMILTFLGGGTWLALFMTGMVTLGGVPFSVVSRVLATPDTRRALFTFRATHLHDLMNDMGIEEEIKVYHSKHIEDPVELDQHIHQILYNWTRYVGANYVVGPRGKLIPKTYDIVDEIYECPGC